MESTKPMLMTKKYREDCKRNHENPFLESILPSALLDFRSSELLHFRYYANTMGRFLKPDNIVQNAANPQSWNLYSYVNGNPVNFNDPSGHACQANIPAPSFMVQTSGADWVNWGAYGSFMSDLYGGNVAFGGAGGGGGTTQSYTYQVGEWVYSSEYMETIRTGPDIAYQDKSGQWHFISGEEQVTHGPGFIYVTYEVQGEINLPLGGSEKMSFSGNGPTANNRIDRLIAESKQNFHYLSKAYQALAGAEMMELGAGLSLIGVLSIAYGGPLVIPAGVPVFAGGVVLQIGGLAIFLDAFGYPGMLNKIKQLGN